MDIITFSVGKAELTKQPKKKKYCHFLSNKNIQMLGEAVVDFDQSLTVTDYIPLYSNYHS